MVETTAAGELAPSDTLASTTTAGASSAATRELQQLATELHRPPQSLTALSDLTPEQLTWLSARVAEVCQREDVQMRTALHRAIPRVLRPLLLRRLRKPS